MNVPGPVVPDVRHGATAVCGAAGRCARPAGVTSDHPARPPAFPPPADQREAAIVLVHGAWAGEWCWSPILPRLRASGRPVHAVSLTGHGNRRHESGPHVTLSDHVADVVGVIEAADLTDVTLVGHSYGGRVITRAWAEVPDRIARLVYLDAHAPIDRDPIATEDRHAFAEANGGMLPFAGYDPDPEEFGGDASVAWFLERVMPQSFATFTEPFWVELPDELPKTYVYVTGNPASRFAGYARVAEASPHWDYHELSGSHWLMVARPDAVAAIILG